jgi:hypothetical protein
MQGSHNKRRIDLRSRPVARPHPLFCKNFRCFSKHLYCKSFSLLPPGHQQRPLQIMFRDGHCGAPSHSSTGVPAAFTAKLNASQGPKFCRLQNGGSYYSQQPLNRALVSPASNAPINADFMQIMRTKMIKAFSRSETAEQSRQDVPVGPPPSLDRVLLRRATLNSRKMHLLSGQVPSNSCDRANIWHDPILVTRPLTLILLRN